eukprot:gnl/MRDRNA2_/MRDRNA2_111530_c0_seq1.p1 gnl/MRDRNA2_/MRDRNA2_111530_c0~~gnl/MRDRNA2_/MRDRNA2_111530_c0_seq1.p1  ORF type:complete len:632 (-),score=111.84 gnl/MRDRNA2_/MRDRNA2_111530_c0_seq1:49-1944(-)
MAPRDEDDTHGEPIFLVRPSENVYSYFMFVFPTETKKKRFSVQQYGINWNAVMAYILVSMNFLFQGVLLYLIFKSVVVENIRWQNGILQIGKDPVIGLVAEPPGKCNDGAALCFMDKGNYSCAPPSIQLTGRWSELDVNGDGIWTLQEVEEQREQLRCKYGVNPVDVFNVIINMLQERKDLIWLHPKIKSGTGIHLPYFTYAMGDLVMCGYRSKDMCGNLLKAGFFDGALKHGTSPRVGNTAETALKYCHDLLEDGGKCERLLPSTYNVWKIQSNIECGNPSYSKFVYRHPKTDLRKSLLSVDYSVREEYELAQDPLFMLFKGVVIFTWMLAMLVEYREVIKIMTLCLRFPSAEAFGDDAVLIEQDPSDPEDVRFRIQGITRTHRRVMMVLCFLRTIVTTVLMITGVSYLIKCNDYADIIMNGVALLFIAEISSVLYSQVLREEIKDQTEDIKPMKVPMYGVEWLNRQPALVDVISVTVLALIVCYIMHWQLTSIVVPVHDALQCTCTSSGPHCIEAQKFNSAFWNKYWTSAVPGVYHEIGKLKKVKTMLNTGFSYGSVVPAISDDNSAPRLDVEARVEELERSNEKLQMRLQELEAKKFKSSINRKKKYMLNKPKNQNHPHMLNRPNKKE